MRTGGPAVAHQCTAEEDRKTGEGTDRELPGSLATRHEHAHHEADHGPRQQREPRRAPPSVPEEDAGQRDDEEAAHQEERHTGSLPGGASPRQTCGRVAQPIDSSALTVSNSMVSAPLVTPLV